MASATADDGLSKLEHYMYELVMLFYYLPAALQT